MASTTPRRHVVHAKKAGYRTAESVIGRPDNTSVLATGFCPTASAINSNGISSNAERTFYDAQPATIEWSYRPSVTHPTSHPGARECT